MFLSYLILCRGNELAQGMNCSE